jgi:hypothetical protein
MLVARRDYEFWPHESMEMPLQVTLGSRGLVMSIGRLFIRIWLGQGVNARLIRHFVRQWLDRLLGRRHLDGHWRECRLIGIQDNLFRPFLLGSDPDSRART